MKQIFFLIIIIALVSLKEKRITFDQSFIIHNLCMFDFVNAFDHKIKKNCVFKH